MAAVVPATSVARTTKPKIKATEVGYFGNGLVAHKIDVVVYSRLQPRDGTRVTVCYEGVCEQARGHSGSLAWYMASFKSQPLEMWAPVTYSAVMSSSSGRTKLTRTKGLLCIHNGGSTPEPKSAYS